MSPVESIVTAHLDTWNATHRAQRARSIASVCSSDVSIGEPDALLYVLIDAP
ncbi:hypothetical protein [Aeromicrobium chenweiae]|uniref:hypothetical protein n=1 Tax=Aeromicrobium chenweiae TaxID=2079793 RepID=UPI00131F09A0|nr:hypothetical protein [Aeromicrobium chenweiae]